MLPMMWVRGAKRVNWSCRSALALNPNAENEEMNHTKEQIRAYVLSEFLPGEDPVNLCDTTPLVTGGILDSLATLKLISFLEDRFGIELEAHETTAEYLNTLPDIAELVQSKLTGESRC